MRKLAADWIFPVTTSPIQNGVVIVDDVGKILSLGERKNFDDAELEIHHGIICPGFINAHCHLELSYMKGKIPEHSRMIQFIIDLLDYRNGFTLSAENDYLEIIYDAIRKSESEMFENGIVAVGDISNDDYTFDFKARSPLKYHTFVECFGFYPGKSESYFKQSLNVFHEAIVKNLFVSLTPHAPYSVSPELFQRIFSFNENHPPLFSYHNQESKAENEFLKSGSGDFIKLFEHFNLPLSIFHPTGKNSLQSVIEYFPSDKKMLLVHNTESTEDDFRMALRKNPETFFCTCPNANLYIESKLPDYSIWKKHSDRICIGTDSLASNHQLSILEEMKTIQKHDSSFTTEQLIQWATWNGAKFFGWENEVGSIEVGKKPGLNLISGLENGALEGSKVKKLLH
ncbi:MAG TPA: amidohydrolase family protein [Chitinophagales bacterium]|nr:amidohydrolase family protein [Chitinophagales bacterium]